MSPRKPVRVRKARSESVCPICERLIKVGDEIAGALRLLEVHGYIRPLPAPQRSGRGRPAAPRYDVCPTPPDGSDRRPETASEQQ